MLETRVLGFWGFMQRTIEGIAENFEPLENIIREKFIPAIVGRKVSDIERRILALPIRLGGLGVQNPVLTEDNWLMPSHLLATQ